MSMKVAIFEDDNDVAQIISEMLEIKDYKVTSYYNFKDSGWQKSDIVLGDFRNRLVQFEQLKQECKKHGIPLIAISGMETTFRPQLLKPFSPEELQGLILETLIKNGKSVNKEDKDDVGFFSFFKKNG